MTKRKPEEQLALLKQRQTALQNRIAAMEARHRKEEDKIMTRKKILIGAYLLEKFKTDPQELGRFIQEMDKFLIRAHDRKLFGFPTE